MAWSRGVGPGATIQIANVGVTPPGHAVNYILNTILFKYIHK